MTREQVPAWVGELKQAARGGARGDDVEVLRGARPRWFDADTGRALSSALLAAFVVAAAIFRARLAGPTQAFDLIALLLRVASVAFVLRAAVSLALLLRRGLREGEAQKCTLVLGPQGLWLSTPAEERWASRDEVLGCALPESVERGATPPAQGPLSLVLKAQGKPRVLDLPPYFAANQEILQARLQRWLGREPGEPASRFDPVKAAPEERYRRIAAGSFEPGELAIPEGFGYRLRAPYGVLLGCLFAGDALLHAGPMARQLWPGVSAACLLALGFLGAWFLWMGGRRKSRLGIAMALTREELLLRGKGGVVGIPWGQLAQVAVDARLTWSPFFGSYPVRVLVLTATDGARVPFDGGFLGLAPDVVRVLCEAYRRREL
jgi:hypothetical protein